MYKYTTVTIILLGPQVISCVRCGTWLHRLLIFAFFLTLGGGEKGYLFSGGCETLVFILGELGIKLIVLGIQGALPKCKEMN